MLFVHLLETLEDLLLLITVRYHSHLAMFIGGKHTFSEQIIETIILRFRMGQLSLCTLRLFLQLSNLVHSLHISGSSFFIPQLVFLYLSFGPSSFGTFLEQVYSTV